MIFQARETASESDLSQTVSADTSSAPINAFSPNLRRPTAMIANVLLSDSFQEDQKKLASGGFQEGKVSM